MALSRQLRIYARNFDPPAVAIECRYSGEVIIIENDFLSYRGIFKNSLLLVHYAILYYHFTVLYACDGQFFQSSTH